MIGKILLILAFVACAAAAADDNRNYTMTYHGFPGKVIKEDGTIKDCGPFGFGCHRNKVNGTLTVSATVGGKKVANVGSIKRCDLSGWHLVRLLLPNNLTLVESIGLTLTPAAQGEKRTLMVGGLGVAGLKPLQMGLFVRPKNTTWELMPGQELVYSRRKKHFFSAIPIVNDYSELDREDFEDFEEVDEEDFEGDE